MSLDYKTLATLLGTVISTLATFYAHRASKGVQEIHLMINSRMDAWLTAAKEAARAEGVRSVLAEGIAKELINTAQATAAKLLVDTVVTTHKRAGARKVR